jgi:hypothetical protein
VAWQRQAKMLTDEDILKLWRDPKFSGSFRGVKTFQVLLKTDLNIEVSERRLYKILKNDSIYLMHKKAIRHFARRHYDVRFYGELVQMDIAYMFNFKGFKYFLLVIDCFSSKIFVKVLKSKDSKIVSNALKDILKDFNSPISVIQSDRGKEFLGKTKDLLKSEKILYRLKYGKNKANYAENGIQIIKRKLYMLLRSQLSHDWPYNINIVVNGYNNTPLKKLGWLAPNDVNSREDSIKVEEAQKKYGIKVYHEPNYKEQLNSFFQTNKNDLKKDEFVYVTFDEKLFDKSFDVQVKFGLLSHQKVIGNRLNCQQYIAFLPLFQASASKTSETAFGWQNFCGRLVESLSLLLCLCLWLRWQPKRILSCWASSVKAFYLRHWQCHWLPREKAVLAYYTLVEFDFSESLLSLPLAISLAA